MKGKQVFLASTTVALIAALAVSPYGVMSARAKLEARAATRDRQNTARHNINTVTDILTSNVESFNASREFDIYYGDLDRIGEIIHGVAGVEIREVTSVDPGDYWKEVGPYVEGDKSVAIKYDLAVVDPLVALGVFEKMELPVHDIVIDYPNQMSITFLTGGEV